MKIKSVHIKNFKIIDDVKIDFGDNDYFLLIGGNGSGKTTVLQAIASTLALATGQIKDIKGFGWKGFDYNRIGEFEVEATLTMDKEEKESVQKVWSAFKEYTKTHENIMFKDEAILNFKKGNRKPFFETKELNFGFCGRQYIRQLHITQKEKDKYFQKIGDVFWFDQRRQFQAEDVENISWKSSVKKLRESLINWWTYHLSISNVELNKDIDWIKKLEERFSLVFNGAKFLGTIEAMNKNMDSEKKEFYFIVEKNGKRYDIAEMSSGEEVIFSLIYQAVKFNISNSIVLIDEVELHLNPREQEVLLKSLPKIFPNCQFIITTHSDVVADFFDETNTIRIENGKRVNVGK